MHSIVLISCASAKKAIPAPARDLYESPLFKKARLFAEAIGGRWLVLSAEHGLVHPDTVLAPYERTLNSMPVRERRAWAEDVLKALDPCLLGVDRVVFLAGHRYREFLEAPLSRRVFVEVPMAGLGIGKQLQWLTQHTARP